jgi:ABC-type hemin transport system ATPase subunit
MRIKALRLEWFRGAAASVTLIADGKSIGVYGPNGAGKSSFVDSVEYGINGGKVAHLVSEYSGRNQQNAIPNTHTPANSNTEFCITFQDNADVLVKIAGNGTHTHTSAQGVNLQEWDYRRTILRQDEVAEFIRSRKGDKYSALLPLFGLHELEVAAENLRQLARHVEQQSRLAQKQGALDQVATKRRQVFGRDTFEAIQTKVVGIYDKYCPEDAAVNPLQRCVEVETALAQRLRKLTEENRRHLTLRTLAGVNISLATQTVRNANARLADSVEPLISEKLAVLQSADAFAAKLDNAAAIDCPACGQSIPAEKFKAHVKTEKERLSEIIAVYEERQRAVGTLIDRVKTLKATFTRPELADWRVDATKGTLKTAAEWIEQCDPEVYRRALSEASLIDVETYCAAIIEAGKTSSGDVPPEIDDLTKDKATIDAAKSVFESQTLVDDIKRIEDLLAFIAATEKGVRAEIRERSEAVITEISGDIAEMWKALHPDQPIDNVRLYLPEEDKAIDIALRFYGKEQDSPSLTLSEGYRNSLGLCIFLALAKREAGNDRPLILDDVVVSLDRNHRGMIVDLLETQFADRQVIIFTHDRDWFAELRHQLDAGRWRFKSMLPYETPEIGIRWSDRTTSFDDARAHLQVRPDSAGNDARKIMDVELALIAEKLQIRLPYLRGERNDHRMWSDFLERLIGDGKKCFQKKSGNDWPICMDRLDTLDSARRLLVSWGNRGSHTTDLMSAEATKLIDTCEKALDVFQCSSCEKPVWLADAEGKEWVQCQCGELRWRYGKG